MMICVVSMSLNIESQVEVNQLLLLDEGMQYMQVGLVCCTSVYKLIESETRPNMSQRVLLIFEANQ
jgi:hypothetical protein